MVDRDVTDPEVRDLLGPVCGSTELCLYWFLDGRPDDQREG